MAPSAFVHEALLVDVDEGGEPAPGAAITVELCGHWEHEGACRWPHYTSATPDADGLRIRTLFACSADDEAEVRARITAALSSGRSPIDTQARTWRLVDSGPADLLPDEAAHAARLAAQD